MTTLDEFKRNGEERYHLRGSWVKVYKKIFKAVVNDIFQVLPILGESGSEVSYFIPTIL